MASNPIKRPTKAGISYQIKWSDADTGEADSETFPATLPNAYEAAKRWKGLVESLGNRRPRAPEPAIPREQETAPELVAQCRAYVDTLPDSQHLYKRRLHAQITHHLEPFFGSCRLTDVSDDDIRKWQGFLATRSIPCAKHEEEIKAKCRDCLAQLSGKSVANIRGDVLAPMYKRACTPRNGKPPLCGFNPLAGVDLPVHRKARRDILHPQELALYMACAYEIDSDAAELLQADAALGARWGEVAGMAVRDIDRRSHEWRPSQVLAQGVDPQCPYGWRLRPYTKSVAGDERAIAIPASIRAMLYRRCEDRSPDDLVFPAPGGEAWNHGRFRNLRYLPILELAQSRGLHKHITPHCLRHSLLTMLADAGEDPKVIQMTAGHASIKTTYDMYIRSTTEQRSSAARRIDERLGAALGAGAQIPQQRLAPSHASADTAETYMLQQ